MALCKRCKNFTKQKGLCLFCKYVLKLAKEFNLILPNEANQ